MIPEEIRPIAKNIISLLQQTHNKIPEWSYIYKFAQGENVDVMSLLHELNQLQADRDWKNDIINEDIDIILWWIKNNV